MTSHTGKQFGPFRLFERLGKGGTASVWRAVKRHDDGADHEVSLKRLHPHLNEDEDAVRRALRRMQKQGVDSLAVCLLFSFVNPVHERRVREITREELPGVMISLSHEVMPSAPEFERTSTTVVNAYVGPMVGRYLESLEMRLRAAGIGPGAEVILPSHTYIATAASVHFVGAIPVLEIGRAHV